MNEKPEILYLTHRIPYPPDKGDKIRSWRLFKHLTERFRVHLACFVDDPADFAHADHLRSLCASAFFAPLHPMRAKLRSAVGLLNGAPLSFPYYNDRAMARAVAELRARPLVAEIAFSSTMAQYIASPIEGRPRIVDFCDADSEKWLQYAEETSGPLGWIYNREGHALARAETKIANWADVSFAVTAQEAGIFNKRKDAQRSVDWWANGVDAGYFDPALRMKRVSDGADIVFTGAMDYRANVDAVHYFVREVLPIVRMSAPYATFAVIGARPVKSITALDGANGVSVTGRVDDVRPWLSQAKLVIAPLRVARGIQNKVLEGMSMAKPVVASVEAATGIIPEARNALQIVDEAEPMAKAIVRLLNDPSLCQRYGAAARAAIVEHYHWDAQLRRFDEALPQALSPYSSALESQSSRLASSG